MLLEQKIKGMIPKLKEYILNISTESISIARRDNLDLLVSYIQEKIYQQEKINVNFICTHNSRRSHFAQVWAQAMAYYFGIDNVFCYSGGTEVTALFPSVVETLKKSGFQIRVISEKENPIYSIKFSDNEHPIIGFSKKLEDDFNPKSKFAAVMTCSQADGGCPFIAGAEKRIPITFEDPKTFDHTPQEAEKYEERSLQIATEFFYVFSQIKS